MGDVTSMADKFNDGRLRSPEDALKDALNDVGKYGAIKDGKKILILGLDDSGGKYCVNFIQAGMTMSQCLTLCEVGKTIFLTEMNYIPGAD